MVKLSEKIEQYRREGEATGWGQLDTVLAQFRDEAQRLEELVSPRRSSEMGASLNLEEAIHHAREVAADSSCNIHCRIEHQQLVEWLIELQNRRKREGRMTFGCEALDGF